MVLTKDEEDILKLTQARDIAQASLRKARLEKEAQVQPLMVAAQQAEEALKTKLEE